MEDYRAIYEERDRLQILDVREPYEWEAGRIEGAIHVPLNDVLAGAEGAVLQKGRPVVVVCRVGNRSELASLMLQARGFDARNMEGGVEGWEAAGLPLTAADGSPGRVA